MASLEFVAEVGRRIDPSWLGFSLSFSAANSIIFLVEVLDVRALDFTVH